VGKGGNKIIFYSNALKVGFPVAAGVVVVLVAPEASRVLKHIFSSTVKIGIKGAWISYGAI
jgi:hypothetical protein